MDTSPEDPEQADPEGQDIDVNRYRRKRRAIYGLLVGGLAAAAVWGVLEMVDQRRNPCQRVHDYYCQRDPGALNCTTYKGILKESEADGSIAMRRNIKHQCERKIERLKSDDGIKVP